MLLYIYILPSSYKNQHQRKTPQVMISGHNSFILNLYLEHSMHDDQARGPFDADTWKSQNWHLREQRSRQCSGLLTAWTGRGKSTSLLKIAIMCTRLPGHADKAHSLLAWEALWKRSYSLSARLPALSKAPAIRLRCSSLAYQGKTSQLMPMDRQQPTRMSITLAFQSCQSAPGLQIQIIQ